MLTECKRFVNVDIMAKNIENKNSNRIQRIKDVFGFETDAQLARYLSGEGVKAHRQSLSRWKKNGMAPVLENLIDKLLEEIDSLKKEDA